MAIRAFDKYSYHKTIMTSVPQRIGNYQLERQIGKGGMSEVWLGRHRSLENRLIAIKLLLSQDLGVDRALHARGQYYQPPAPRAYRPDLRSRLSAAVPLHDHGICGRRGAARADQATPAAAAGSGAVCAAQRRHRARLCPRPWRDPPRCLAGQHSGRSRQRAGAADRFRDRARVRQGRHDHDQQGDGHAWLPFARTRLLGHGGDASFGYLQPGGGAVRDAQRRAAVGA